MGVKVIDIVRSTCRSTKNRICSVRKLLLKTTLISSIGWLSYHACKKCEFQQNKLCHVRRVLK